MKIITKNFNGTVVLFSNDSSIRINASHIAESFKKQPAHWLRNKDTKEYIEAVSETYNLTYDEMVLVKKGNFSNGNTQGTWLHQKLILAFARWLSPKFAVWCDQQIEEILKSKSSQSSQPKENIDLDEILAISKKMLELASMFGLSRESRYLSADSGVEKITGNSPLKLLGISQRISIENMPRI